MHTVVSDNMGCVLLHLWCAREPKLCMHDVCVRSAFVPVCMQNHLHPCTTSCELAPSLLGRLFAPSKATPCVLLCQQLGVK